LISLYQGNPYKKATSSGILEQLREKDIPYVGAAGKSLHIYGKFTMRKLK
jgi:hypothetical protein